MYSTKASGDATVIVGETSGYFTQLAAIDGVQLTSYSTKMSSDARGWIVPGLDGWKRAYLSPGYHCIAASLRNYATASDRKWNSYETSWGSCFDLRRGHVYSLDRTMQKTLLGEKPGPPTVTDTTLGKVVLANTPSAPGENGTAILSVSGSVFVYIDGTYTKATAGGLFAKSARYEISPGYHAITMGTYMVAYDFPAGRDTRLARRDEGIYILEGETGRILKSPGGDM